MAGRPGHARPIAAGRRGPAVPAGARPSLRRLTALLRGAALLALLAAACGGGGGPAGLPGPPDPGATLLRTESERAGEAIYRRERCARCHTLHETPLPAGPPLLPGPPESSPGSRLGPDLGSEGHRHSDDWHLAHLYAPTVLVPGSRMPPYRHLFRFEEGRPVPGRQAVDLVAYVQALGRGRRDVWAEWRRTEPVIPSRPAPGPSLRARGAALYARLCAPCHGGAGDGRGAVAALLGTGPRDFVAGHYRFKSVAAGEAPADADLYRSITLGSGTGAPMPSFYWLTPLDRWALVARLKEFSPRLAGGRPSAAAGIGSRQGAPRGGRDRGDDPGPGGGGSILAEGRRQWDDLGCASCHGATGEGLSRDEAGADWTDPDGLPVARTGSLGHACALRGGASPDAIERAVVLGVGTAMPAYGESLQDARSRRALVAYVLSLQEIGGR